MKTGLEERKIHGRVHPQKLSPQRPLQLQGKMEGYACAQNSSRETPANGVPQAQDFLQTLSKS